MTADVITASVPGGPPFTVPITIGAAGGPPFTPAAGAYFGAYPGAGDAAPNAGFESANMANRQLDVYMRYYAFSSGAFPAAADETLMAAGRYGYFSLQNQFGSTYTIKWAAVAAGSYDTQLNAIAAAIKAGGRKCFIGWENEPDDGGKIGTSGNVLGTAADYIAGFKHVAAVLRAGAPGLVSMTYVPYGPTAAAAACYPGDLAADVLGVDPYDEHLSHGTALATYQPVITWLNTDPLAVAGGAGTGGGHGKPLGIFETGVDQPPANTDANVASWISGVPAALASLSSNYGNAFRVWLWFNSSGTLGNCTIVPGSLSAAALAAIGANPFFNQPHA